MLHNRAVEKQGEKKGIAPESNKQRATVSFVTSQWKFTFWLGLTQLSRKLLIAVILVSVLQLLALKTGRLLVLHGCVRLF